MIREGIYNKYWGRQEPDLNGGRAIGWHPLGFPIVGDAAAPHLKGDEADNLPLFNTFHARWFRMWDPEDLATFVRVMDHVYNGVFNVQRRIDVPVPDPPADEPGGGLKVWL